MSNIPRITRMNSIQMHVLNCLSLVIDNNLVDVVPGDVICRVVWEVALLGDKLTMMNYRGELHHCIVATLKDVIYHDLLVPYLNDRNVKIPHGMLPMDILEILCLRADLYNIKALTTIYNSLTSLGLESLYFKEVLAYIEYLPKSDVGETATDADITMFTAHV